MLEDGVERVKVTDFGLAVAAMSMSELTSLDQIAGTPSYMSPEQIASPSSAIDPRSDLFSLGCVMYAMVTGQSPFKGAHTLDVIQKVGSYHPPLLHDVDPTLPRYLSDIVDRLLRKEPAERFTSATELADVLRQHLAVVNRTETETVVPILREQTRPPRRRQFTRSARHAAVFFLFLTIAAAGIWKLVRTRQRPVLTAPPTWTVSEILTVGHSASAQFRTLAKALDRAAPGTTIQILDDATYEGPLLIKDSTRLRGITIESTTRDEKSASQPTLITKASNHGAVVEIRGTSGVTLRGITIRPRSQQHAIFIAGACEGTLIENVHSLKEDTTGWSHVNITDEAHGSAQKPIELRNCSFEFGAMGVVIGSSTGQAPSFVRLQQNHFTGNGIHIMLVQSVRDVQVVNNFFLGGRALHLALKPELSQNINLTNNSFLAPTVWLDPADSSADVQGVIVCNNAIFDSECRDSEALTALARSWQFSHNLCETGSSDTRLAEHSVTTCVPYLDVVSRDPEQSAFLQPTNNSVLATSGAGQSLPTYVGARLPADH
jgi:hypothetical protein